MRNRTMLACVALGMICLLIPAFFAARQTAGAKPTAAPKAASAATKTWSAPKTPWGDPDLQGTWTSDDT
jgi:curli biogenesis system outer membrane secretion channel CsgG